MPDPDRGRAHRAVLLDRDGTLIADTGYPRDPDAVTVLPGAVETVRTLRDLGYRLGVVSNQSGIGRGIISPAQAEAVHTRFVGEFADAGVEFDAVLYCPHAPEAGCACRKPAPGMLLDAASRLDLDLGRSFMVGDRESDIEAGLRAGTRTILLDLTAHARAGTRATAVAPDWPAVGRLVADATPA